MAAPNDTTAYPVFASKAAMCKEVLVQLNSGTLDPYSILCRIGNTDTSGWADPTYHPATDGSDPII